MKKTLTAILSFVFAVSLCGAAACVTDSQPQTLAAPEITLDDNVVSWGAVENATGYDVYVADDAAVSVTETSYTISKTDEGSYEIYVIATSTDEKYTASAPSNKVTYVVEHAVLSSLRLASAPDKDVYYLDEKAEEPDLTGLSVKAVYSNATERVISLSDLEISGVNLTEEGEKQITLSYSEEGITKEVKLNIEVKERTLADMKAGSYVVKNNEYSATATEYELADGTVSAVNMMGEAVEVTVIDGKTYISASNFQKPSAMLLRVTDGQNNVTFIKVTAATFVAAVEDFNSINNALDGYYVLIKDIYFENGGAMIGKAGLNADAEGANAAVDPTGAGNTTGQQGAAFTGTFDGNGYIIHDYSIAYDKNGYSAWQAPSFYMGMFGWIGEGGTVCNFTLRSSTVRAGQNSALIAGVNDGIIENVVIEADCKLEVNYYEHGAVAACNNGRIDNVICYTESFPRNEEIKVTNAVLEGNGKVENYYADNKTDLTATLGAGWFYIKDHGTVYGNDTYAILLSYNEVWYIGMEAHVSVYIRNAEASVAFQTWGVSGVDGSESVKYVSYDAETYTYTVKLADGITAENIAENEFNFGAQIVGRGYIFTKTVKIGAPYVVKAEAEDFSLTEGIEIDVAGKQINLTYTDGSTKTVPAVKAEGYNKNGTVGTAQTVKLFYGEGENEYAEISVTPVAKQVTAVKAADDSTHKTSFTVGDTFSFAGLKLEITYDNGTKDVITATAVNVDYTAVNLTTAGSYKVTLSYGGHEGEYTVNVASATLSSITVSGTPAKTEYKIDETVSVADLAGITVTAHYSDNSTQTVEVTAQMLSYDFSSEGSKNITITYEGKTANVSVTVADYVTGLNVTLKDADSKAVEYTAGSAADFGSICNFTVTMKSGSNKTVTSGVTADVTKSGLQKVQFSYGDVKVTPDIEFEVWYIVNSVADWNSINDNLSGYYALGGDLDFNYNATAIGVAPLYVASDETYIDTGSLTGGQNTREGVPFTGIFDGRGHKLVKFRVGEYEEGYNAAYMGMAPFMYVGEGGKVTNFEVYSAILSVCNFGSLAVCLNRGEVSNVTISAENRFNSNWNASAAIVNANLGTVKNCVSYLTSYNVLFNSTVAELPVVYQNAGTLEDNFALTTQISLDGSVKLDFYYFSTVDFGDPIFWTWGVPNYSDGENNGSAVSSGWGGFSGSGQFGYHYVLTLAANSGLNTGDTFSLGFRISGGEYTAFTVTVVGEAAVAYCL